MTHSKYLLLILFSTVLVSAKTCTTAEIQNEPHAVKSISKEFKIVTDGRISVDTHVGNIVVQLYKGDSVKVSVTIAAKNENQLGTFIFETHNGNNGLKITGRREEGNTEISVSIVISVPYHLKLGELSLLTETGDMTVYGVKSDSILLRSNTGDTWLRGISSDTKVKSTAGGLYMSQVSGRLDVALQAGDIFATDLSGDVSANVGAGDEDIHLGPGIQRATLTTGAGEIHIALPQGIGVDLNAKAEGKLHRIFFMPSLSSAGIPFRGMMRGRNVEIRINGGGVRISAMSRWGNIFFELKSNGLSR